MVRGWDRMEPMPGSNGGLVFAGDFDCSFRAFDAQSGKVLWEIPLSGPVERYPISYAADDRQYVAVSSGSPSDFWVIGHSGSPTIVVFALPRR